MNTKHISKYHLRLTVLASIFTALVWQFYPSYVEGVSDRIYLAEQNRIEAEALLAIQKEGEDELVRVEAKKQSEKEGERQRREVIQEEDMRIMEEVRKNHENGEVLDQIIYWKMI